MGRICAVCIAMALLGVATAGQEPTPARFEVASVKLHDPTIRAQDTRPIQDRGPIRSFDIRGDALSAMNWDLMALIVRAYGIPEQRVEKVPSWVRTASFDIRAKAPRAASKAEMDTMLRDLLSDRFQLKAHVETRVSDVYFLVRVEKAGLGSGLHPIDIDCDSNTLNPSSGAGLFPPDARPKCGNFLVTFYGYKRTQHAGVTLARFAKGLSGELGRPVIDRTGLTGTFDIELTHRSDAALALVSERDRPAREAAAPSIRDALKEQLGLTVTSGRDSIDFLVLDSLERLIPD